MTAVTRYRGDTAPDVFIIRDAEGVLLNITGYSFLMTVNPERTPADAADQLFQLTGVIVDAPNGRVSFAPDADQADQTPGKYYYDVQMTDGGGIVTTIALDGYTFRQDITKA